MPDDPLEWTTLDSETAYTCPGFSVQRDAVRLPDDTETDFHYVVEDETVVVIPYTPAGELVVIDEWRQAVGRVNRGLPAGNVEPTDEDLSAAAHRELREETGYVADDVTHLTSVEPTNGIANALHHYFIAHACREAETQTLDTNESIRVTRTTEADLYEAAVTGELRDGRAVLGILLARAESKDD